MNAMAATSRPLKTADEFMALGDEVRAELIAGEIFMAPAPTRWHQNVAGNLYELLAPHARTRGRGDASWGTVWIAPLDVHLPSGDIVQPDLIFVRTENWEILQDWIRGTPDLLIEIVSPSNAERDRIVKRALYARNGVSEYWIVDPDVRTVEVLRLRDGTYEPAGYFGAGTELVSSVLPDLRLPIDEVFRPAL